MYRKLCIFVFACLFGFSFAARAAVDAASETSSDLGSNPGLSTGAKVGIAAGATALVGGAVTAIAIAASNSSGSSSNSADSPDQNNPDNIGPGPDNSVITPALPINTPDQPLIPLSVPVPPIDKGTVIGEWNDQSIYTGKIGQANTSGMDKTKYIWTTTEPLPGSIAPDTTNIVTNGNLQTEIDKLDILNYTYLQAQPNTGKNPGTLYFADPWADASTGGLPSHNDTFCTDGSTYNVCTYIPLTGKQSLAAAKGNFQAFSLLQNQKGTLKKIFSVGGPDNYQSFTGVLGNSLSENNFIDSAAKIINHYNLDGINLAFEEQYKSDGSGFSATEANLYAKFITNLRTKLGPDKLIIITVPADINWYQVVGQYNWNIIAQNVNAVVVRSYDFHGGFDAKTTAFTGYMTSVYGDNFSQNPFNTQGGNDYSLDGSVKSLGSYNVPAEKIIASVPTYGRAVQMALTVFAPIMPGFNVPVGDMDKYSCADSKKCTGKFTYNYLATSKDMFMFKEHYARGDDNANKVGGVWDSIDTSKHPKSTWAPTYNFPLPPDYYSPAMVQYYTLPFISFADTKTTGNVVMYVNSNKLGGMMLSNISYDVLDPANSAKSLLTVIANYISK